MSFVICLKILVILNILQNGFKTVSTPGIILDIYHLWVEFHVLVPVLLLENYTDVASYCHILLSFTIQR